MTEDEARRFVLGMLLHNARGDNDAIGALAETYPHWGLPEYAAVLRASATEAFIARTELANLLGVSLEEHLEELVLEAAAEEDL